MRLEGYGIGTDIPDGWEGRIFRLAGGWPTLHVANFPLPPTDGEFGSLALSSMTASGAFLALTEYAPRLARRGLFGSRTVTRSLAAADFDSHVMVRMRPGRFGVQRFFTVGTRPFCLHVVVGSSPSVSGLAAGASSILAGLRIDPFSTFAGPEGAPGADEGSLRRL
jgi:hypothetical protein